jgi:hypothetical protein
VSLCSCCLGGNQNFLPNEDLPEVAGEYETVAVRVLGNTNEIRKTTLAVTCWFIWETRNGARNEQGMLHRERVAGKVKAYVDNIVLHCYKPASTTRCDSSTCRWIPPLEGRFV